LEMVDHTVSGLASALTLMMVWNSIPDHSKSLDFVFSIAMVFLILTSIMKPLSCTKRYQLETILSSLVCGMQLIGTGLTIWRGPNISFIPLLAINLVTGGIAMPLNICLNRLACALIIILTYNLSAVQLSAVISSCTDILFQAIKYHLIVRRSNLSNAPSSKTIEAYLDTEEVAIKPKNISIPFESTSDPALLHDRLTDKPMGKEPGSKKTILTEVKDFEAEPFKTLDPNSDPNHTKDLHIHSNQTFANLGAFLPQYQSNSHEGTSNRDQTFRNRHHSRDKDGRTITSSRINTIIEKSIAYEDLPKINFYSPEQAHKTAPLPPHEKEQQHHTKVSRNSSFLETSVMPIENIKLRVFAEYFSMIDELVLVADKRLNVINSNHSPRNANFVVNRIRKRFNITNFTKPGATLDQLFRYLPADQLQCGNDTVSSLVTLFSSFDYKKNKLILEKMEGYKKARIDSILQVIESLQTGIKLSNQTEKDNKITNPKQPLRAAKTLGKVKSSMKAINKNNVVNCEFCIPELLWLVKEYLSILNESCMKYHFTKEMVFTFYFKENVQFKLRLVQLEGRYYLICIFENIQEKNKLCSINAKLNYSFMLTNSLTHELFTPIHQILSYSDTLIAEMGQPAIDREKLKESMTAIKQIASGLFLSIKNMMDYASIINHSFKLEKSRFLIKDVLEYLVSCFSMKAKKQNIIIRFECDKNLELYSDENRLKGLLFIFVENSIQFTKQGGVLMSVKQKDNRIIFKVIDSGKGIVKEDLDKMEQILHNPFLEDTTRDSAGIGLGLRIAQHLYKKLTTGDQIIEIKSMEGVGTTIQFEIVQSIERSYSKHSPSNSYRSGASMVMVNANVDVESELQGEFRDERNPLFNGVAKLLLNQAKSCISPLRGDPSSKFQVLVNNNEVENNGSEPQGTASPTISNNKNQYSSGALKFLPNRDSGAFEQCTLTNKQVSNDRVNPDAGEPNLLTPKADMPFRRVRRAHHEYSAIELPPESSVVVELKPMQGSGIGDSHKKVALVVDDDTFNRDTMTNFFIMLNLEPHPVEGGQEAVELCEYFLSIGKKINIIMMDYHMPGLQGDETTRILREPRFDPILKDTPIIGITAHSDASVKESCLKSGMNQVENKPFQFDKLKSLLVKLKLIEVESENKQQITQESEK
jgi:signal transduction histidine kinase/CheY-like chemotaxis protein